MRTLNLVAPLLLLSMAAFGQDGPLTITRADNAYANHEYLKAATLYEQVAGFHKVPTDLPNKLADCYRQLNDYVHAAKWYQRVTQVFPSSSQDWIWYGDALKSLGMYADAKAAYRHLPDSLYQRIWDKVAGCDSALAWIASPGADQVNNMEGINSENADWGATWYHHSIVFTSDRPDASTGLDKETGRSFQKVYVVDGGPLSLDSVSAFSPEVNRNIYHDGAIAFSPDGDTAYYSLTNPGSLKDPIERIKGKEGKRKVVINYKRLELWWSVRDSSGAWGPAQSFPYNNKHYSVGQPALSPDGRVLYFASDMPGGYGRSDLWYVERQADGSWSAPINCGPSVNTDEDDAFPYVGPDGALYFASKGHIGMGGFDIFQAGGARASWTDVRNLRYPINSPGDDFYFTLKDSLSGFLSSNRPGGKGNDDIYAFTLHPVTPPEAFTPLRPDTSLVFTEVAHCTPVVPVFVAAAPGTKKPPVGGSDDADEPPAPPRIRVLKTLVVDWLSGEPLGGAGIAMTGASPFTTGPDGARYQVLDPKNALIDSAFKEGYTGNGQRIGPLGPAGPDTVLVTLRLLKKPETGDLFELRKLYFDFDRWNIRPDAATELDRLVAYLRQFPMVIIDLSAHTDSRGNDDYNQLLSEKRASSARAYLLRHGIALHRIIVHGYGESMPVNGCKNGVVCTEAEYQLNRRVEIKILQVD